MGKLDEAPLVACETRAEWRAWLEANHATAGSAWLVTWRRATGRPVLAYEDAVEEALCFGWIDGQTRKLDDERGAQYFAPRKRGGTWAASNKERVARLAAEGRMAPAGMAAVEQAKADGSWTLLDEVEAMIVPADLAEALAAHPPAAERWDGFSPSARRMILWWILQAKRPTTRAARIEETAALAAQNVRVTDRPRTG
jgi:uncharacterized protein YdeI (YjbR/CyaY-like superfamily)